MLKQIDLPHSYYYREMFLPQLTSGPSGVAFSPDGQSLVSPADAAYFVKWMDRVIAAAEARMDYNDGQEKQGTLEYLRAARRIFVEKAQ